MVSARQVDSEAVLQDYVYYSTKELLLPIKWSHTVETRIKEPTFLGDSRLIFWTLFSAFTIHILGIGKV